MHWSRAAKRRRCDQQKFMKNFLYCTKLVSLSDEIAVNLEKLKL